MTADLTWYQFLTDAQRRAIAIWSVHVPWLLYTTPTELTSADGGATYAFPLQITSTDSGATATVSTTSIPLGKFELRDGRNGPLLTVGADFSQSADFVLESTRVRVTNGRTRTFPAGLYLRYVPAPTPIGVVIGPALMPEYARIILVYDAVATWCQTIGQKDPAPFERLYNQFLWGNPATGDIGVLGALKQAALGQNSDPDVRTGAPVWWRQLR